MLVIIGHDMNWVIYLKTTETCNLNCRHCFTNGISGKRIFWNVDNTIDWVRRLIKEAVQPNDTIHFEFHGGEPLLVPVDEMRRVVTACQHLHPYISWGMTSNLVLKLTDNVIDFVKNCLNNRIGTSWDPNIRFSNEKQRLLWENNVRTLMTNGVDVKLNVSVTADLLDMEPMLLLEWVKLMGFKEMSLERLTENGNAKLHPDIFPMNTVQDAWFLKMHLQSEEMGARTWFVNEFLENVYDKFSKNVTTSGTFCRDCEEKIFTINADGTISGCPNSAPEFNYGNVTGSISSMMNHPPRSHAIACERARDERCYTCPVFIHCGGDCHQLSWQGGVCGAPKSLMSHLSGINTQHRKIFLMRTSNGNTI